MRNLLFVCLILFPFGSIIGQSFYSLSGILRDKETEKPIQGAMVSIKSHNLYFQTDDNGYYHLDGLKQAEYLLVVELVGYERMEQMVYLKKNTENNIYLSTTDVSLDEIVISHSKEEVAPIHFQKIDKSYILQNNASSFAQTLSKVSGVSSMNIGSAASKPFIRGLGFNRIAVVDKGIMQQDQQWGADHGLEIDQFSVEDILIHKGPMSLQFGSDAMGGAIEVRPTITPNENIYLGEAIFIAKSNNDLLGISVMNALKHNKWFVKARYTGQAYGDYRVPADNFNYLTYDLPIYNRRLKNTAGKEDNISGLIRYSSELIENTLSISNVYRKTGFFPGAHGIPDKSRLLHDDSFRNIEMPYTNVNHLKIINNTNIILSKSISWDSNIGFQDNHRQEWAYFHTHYGELKPPQNDPDLELDFRLNTYSFNNKFQINKDAFLSHIAGLSSEFQQNRVRGYSFLLPQFDQLTAGAYWLSSYKYTGNLTFLGGIRYDYGKIDIKGFYDPTLAEYLRSQGLDEEKVQQYAQRAYATNPHFGNISGSLGIIFNQTSKQEWKVNLGSSFRMPTANELASNGVHHGAFRHEQGNPNLQSERGYQLDVTYSLKHKYYNLSISPFSSYYTNYIFLDPQGDWSVLPHAGQVYRYRGTEAFFAGAEYQLNIDLTTNLEFVTSGDYVFNRNLTDNYSLPFTPPLSLRNELSFKGKSTLVQSYRFALEHQYFATQNEISQNEKSTPQANLFNFLLNTNVKLNSFTLSVNLQVMNVFDTKYLNHMSFYRKLNIPEPGRNIQLLIKIPFYNSKN